VLEIREAQARAERQRRRGDDPERDARLRTVGVDALGFSQEILEGNALPGAGFSPGSCSAWAVVYRRGVRWLAVTSLLAVGCAPMTTSDFPSDPRLQSYLLIATRALSGESFAFAFERAPAALPAAFADDAELVLFGYDRPLAEMAFVPLSGPPRPAFEVAISTALERPIPVQDGFVWQRSSTGFVPLGGAPASLQQARLLGFAASCAGQGGCPEELDGIERCNFACTPPTPLSPEAPRPPAPPELPVLTPCPLDWDTVSATISSLPGQPSVARCASPPLAPVPRCGPGEAAFVGSAGCAPVGRSCPASGFDPGLVADLYVDAAAAPAGDGTRLAPLASLERAIALAEQRGLDRIAVARGEYALAGLRARGLQITGACPGETRLLLGPQALVSAGPARLSQLTLVGPTRPPAPARFALEVVLPGSLALESVIVDAGGGPGIGVGLSTITLDRVALRGASGGALHFNRSHSTLNQVVLQNLQGHAIELFGGRAEIVGLAVDGLDLQPGTSQDAVALLGYGTTLRVAQAELRDIDGVAVYVTSSSAALDQVRIDDVRQAPPSSALPTTGSGICAFGSTVSVSRSSITRVSGSGLLAYSGAELRASDVVLSEPRPTTALGAVVCAAGSRCDLSRAAILGSPTGLVVQGSPQTQVLDVVIDGQGQTSTAAPAVNVFDNTQVSLARVVSVGSAYAGMTFERTTVFLTDLWIDDLRGGPVAPFGLFLSDTAVTLARSRIAGSDRLLGILRGSAAVADLDLGFNRAVARQPLPEAAGLWQRDGTFSLERARVHDIEDLAVLIVNSPSVSVRDLDVESVRRGQSVVDAAVLFFWSPDLDWTTSGGRAAQLARLRVRGVENTALALEDLGTGAAPTHVLEDLLIADSTADCEPNPDPTPRICGTLDLRGKSRTRGARWDVEGRGLRLLRLNDAATLQATDVRLAGAASSKLLAMENSASVELERFVLRGQGVCVDFQGPDPEARPGLQLSKGRLDCETSFETGCQFEGQEALREVLVQSNRGLRCVHPLQQLGR